MAQLADSLTYKAQTALPARLPDGFGLNREVRRFVETYTVAEANPAAADWFNLVKFQPGGNLKLVPHLSRVSHQGSATVLTLSLVDSAGNVLMAAVNALTANGIAFASENMEVAVPADGIIRVKLDTETGLVPNDVLQFFLAFVQE